MGGSNSKNKDISVNITKLKEKINEKRENIDVVHNEIIREGDEIITDLERKGYLNNREFCDRIGYIKANELRDFFPITVLQNVRYRMGIVPEQNNILENNKLSVCNDIIAFHQRKIKLIQEIKEQMPKCKEIEGQIWSSLGSNLSQLGVSQKESLFVYNEMDKFNSDIGYRYKQIKNNIERIKKAKTNSEINRISKTINSLLATTTSECKTYENRLLKYHTQQGSLILPTSASRPSNPPLSQTSTSSSNTSYEKYQAEYDFYAEQEGEINVKEGEEVTLLSTEDKYWAYVEKINGEKGYVPLSYLNKIV